MQICDSLQNNPSINCWSFAVQYRLVYSSWLYLASDSKSLKRSYGEIFDKTGRNFQNKILT